MHVETRSRLPGYNPAGLVQRAPRRPVPHPRSAGGLSDIAWYLALAASLMVLLLASTGAFAQDDTQDTGSFKSSGWWAGNLKDPDDPHGNAIGTGSMRGPHGEGGIEAQSGDDAKAGAKNH